MYSLFQASGRIRVVPVKSSLFARGDWVAFGIQAGGVSIEIVAGGEFGVFAAFNIKIPAVVGLMLALGAIAEHGAFNGKNGAVDFKDVFHSVTFCAKAV